MKVGNFCSSNTFLLLCNPNIFLQSYYYSKNLQTKLLSLEKFWLAIRYTLYKCVRCTFVCKIFHCLWQFFYNFSKLFGITLLWKCNTTSKFWINVFDQQTTTYLSVYTYCIQDVNAFP